MAFSAPAELRQTNCPPVSAIPTSAHGLARYDTLILYLAWVYLIKVCGSMAIRGFADVDTKKFFETGRVGKRVGWASVRVVAARKLDMLHYAAALQDLRVPPGNRLEALRGNLAGLHSIRINEQWRVVFRWANGGAEEVRTTDYH